MSRWSLLLISILVFAAGINFLGVLVPERGFDALWYHLTIPKIYLSRGEIFHIPGGLLYHSALPRLGEILYLLGIKIDPVIGPHLVSWASGISSAVLIYLIARLYIPKSWALLA